METIHHPFIGTKEPVTTADLAEVEQAHGFVLPEDYKAHLLRYNGGWPQGPGTFLQTTASGRQVGRSINQLYSIKYGKDTVAQALRDLRGDLHPDLVPFGDDAGGDQFCLSVGPEDYGSIYYIAHEFYTPPKKKEREQPRQYGKGVHFLAPSFTAFLEGLVELPDDDDE